MDYRSPKRLMSCPKNSKSVPLAVLFLYVDKVRKDSARCAIKCRRDRIWTLYVSRCSKIVDKGRNTPIFSAMLESLSWQRDVASFLERLPLPLSLRLLQPHRLYSRPKSAEAISQYANSRRWRTLLGFAGDIEFPSTR